MEVSPVFAHLAPSEKGAPGRVSELPKPTMGSAEKGGLVIPFWVYVVVAIGVVTSVLKLALEVCLLRQVYRLMNSQTGGQPHAEVEGSRH